MRISYLPKSRKEYKFIYKHLNEDFPAPKENFREFIKPLDGDKLPLSLVFYTVIEGEPEVLWGLEHDSDIKATSLEDFYKRYQEFKLEKLL